MQVHSLHSSSFTKRHYCSVYKASLSDKLFDRFNAVLETHIETGKYVQGIIELEDILAKTPAGSDNIDLRHQVCFYLGLSHRYLGNKQRANEYFQKVYAIEETYYNAGIPSLALIIDELKKNQVPAISYMFSFIRDYYEAIYS